MNYYQRNKTCSTRIPFGERVYILLENLPLYIGGWNGSGTAFYFESTKHFSNYISNGDEFGQPASLRRMFGIYGFQSGKTKKGKLVFMHNQFQRYAQNLDTTVSKKTKSTHAKEEFKQALLDIDDFDVDNFAELGSIPDTVTAADLDFMFSDPEFGGLPFFPCVHDGIHEQTMEIIEGHISSEVCT
jgi:hypothetical protein